MTNNCIKKEQIKGFKTLTIPAKVNRLKATGGKKSVRLSWTKASGAKKYQVQRYIVSKKIWKTYATVNNTSYTFKNIAPGKNQKFRVRAVNEQNCGKIYGEFSKVVTK